MAPATLALIDTGEAKKGDVLAAARIAGIMAAKKTHELIPLCHPLAITKVTVDFETSQRARRHPRHGRGEGRRPDRRRDGGADGRLGRLPHHLRHAQGRRQSHDASASIRLIEKTGGRSGTYRARGQQRGAERHGPAVGRRSPAAHPRRRRADRARARRHRAGARPRAGRAAARARHPAAVQCLRHGRLCRARCRRERSCRPRSPSSARPPLDIPSAAASAKARPCASSPARPCPRAPTPSSSRRTRSATAPASSCAKARSRRATSARKGFDFREGDTLLAAGRRLGPREVSLAAAMGHGQVAVRRRPRVAILSTGDELVPPGTPPRAPARSSPPTTWGSRPWPRPPAQRPQQLGIARDTRADLGAHFAKARRRRHPRHQRRRLGRRPRPGGAGAGSAAA